MPKRDAGLTGKKIGKLTVIGRAGHDQKDPHRNAMWLCQCECGSVVVRSSAYLREAKYPNCGCVRLVKNAENLAGKKFGWLTAIRHVDYTKDGGAVWECKCDCGKTKRVAAHELKRPQTGITPKSCGCQSQVYRKNPEWLASRQRDKTSEPTEPVSN
jgi:hypothetical protein